MQDATVRVLSTYSTRSLARIACLVVPLRPIATCSGCLRRLAISPRGAAIVESPFENNTRPVDVMLSWPPWRANVAPTSCAARRRKFSSRARSRTHPCITHLHVYISPGAFVFFHRVIADITASVCERTNTYTDYFYLPDWSLDRPAFEARSRAGPSEDDVPSQIYEFRIRNIKSRCSTRLFDAFCKKNKHFFLNSETGERRIDKSSTESEVERTELLSTLSR